MKEDRRTLEISRLYQPLSSALGHSLMRKILSEAKCTDTRKDQTCSRLPLYMVLSSCARRPQAPLSDAWGLEHGFMVSLTCIIHSYRIFDTEVFPGVRLRCLTEPVIVGIPQIWQIRCAVPLTFLLPYSLHGKCNGFSSRRLGFRRCIL